MLKKRLKAYLLRLLTSWLPLCEPFRQTQLRVDALEGQMREQQALNVAPGPFLVNDGTLGRSAYLPENLREPAVHDEDQLYDTLAVAFRSNAAWLHEEMERLAAFIRPVAGESGERLPIIDVGCGRGALLDVLKERGIPAVGVDLNEKSAQVAREHGHEVIIGDGLSYLRQRPAASCGGIALIMVSEHIPFSEMYQAMFLFADKTARGGVLIINTINPYCVRRLGHFCMDPSHKNFAPPDLYKVVMEMAGFVDVKMVWSAPISGVVPKDDWYAGYENVTLVGYRA